MPTDVSVINTESMPESTCSAISALREATGPLHDRLEKMLAITHPQAGVDDYHHYLLNLWGWHQSFEKRLWSAVWPQQMEVAERAAKLSRLEQDLRSLGYDDSALATIPICSFDPDLDSEASRFGTAYVVEGAQLGIRVLRKTLEARLPWHARWLEGYGENAGKKWKSFLICLEQSVNTSERRQVAAQAAKAAFESLADWFEVCSSNRNLPISGIVRN